MNLAADPQFPTQWPAALPGDLPHKLPNKLPNKLPKKLPSKWPTKWPFPPASGARRAWGVARPSGVEPRATELGDTPSLAAGLAAGRALTRRDMIVDVLLVAMWGAMIPALMWLGAAAGF